MENKYETFLNYLNELLTHSDFREEDKPEGFADVVRELENKRDAIKNKPLFTETGLEILDFMQNSSKESLTAKEIGEGLGTSSRIASGAMRKLTEDGYVAKDGSNPVVYNLTDKGKSINITETKEKMSNKGE